MRMVFQLIVLFCMNVIYAYGLSAAGFVASPDTTQDNITNYLRSSHSCGLALRISNPSAQLDGKGNVIGYKSFVVPCEVIQNMRSKYSDTTLIHYSLKYLNSLDTALSWSSNVLLHYIYGIDVTYLIKYTSLNCEMWFIEEKEKYRLFWKDFFD